MERVFQTTRRVDTDRSSEPDVGHGCKAVLDAPGRPMLVLWLAYSPAFVRSPECNEIIERFNRILQEQVFDIHCFETIEEARVVIQPFVENSLWHGIIDSGHKGLLTISFSFEEIDIDSAIRSSLVIKVTDNRIGLKATLTKKDKEDHISKGIQIVEERLRLLSAKMQLLRPRFLQNRLNRRLIHHAQPRRDLRLLHGSNALTRTTRRSSPLRVLAGRRPGSGLLRAPSLWRLFHALFALDDQDRLSGASILSVRSFVEPIFTHR